ncbi:unnamed protein product [Triticum turgidum subsp. durum]|uniref:Uncharacterized protein n=1 Tax=Triticum turgidum subsp. durum TaxID=4567 RepID=A0A9R1BTF5_TRITD|nr:unnamed protein product [Triticum turgidum subsp. durum]
MYPRPFLLLWDPVTGDQTRLAVPPELYGDGTVILTGALLCSAGDQGHAHGDCRRSGHFQVALIATARRSHSHLFATPYSSATSKWGKSISMPFIHSRIKASTAMKYFQPVITPTILIGNSVYWSYVLGGACIIEFDLDAQRLALIEPPPDAYAHDDTVFAVMPAEDGGLGLIVVLDFRAQLWKWKAGVRHDDATWVLGRIVELDKLLPLGAAGKRKPLALVGFDGENNVTLVRTSCGIFLVHLHSMTFKRLCNSGSARDIHIYNAFSSFYDAGNTHDKGGDCSGRTEEDEAEGATDGGWEPSLRGGGGGGCDRKEMAQGRRRLGLGLLAP